MGSFLWMIHPGAPDELYELLKGKDLSVPETYIDELKEAESKGWITILGSFEQDPGDVKAVITEHMDVRCIKPEDLKQADE